MSTHHEANDRAMRRCEEAYLREPEWRTSAPCQGCGETTSDGTLCETCAEEIEAMDNTSTEEDTDR